MSPTSNVGVHLTALKNNVVIKYLFHNIMEFALHFYDSLSLHLKKKILMITGISVNHIFHATAPTITLLIKVLDNAGSSEALQQ